MIIFRVVFYCALVAVSWSLTSPFSTNMAISETKGQGWRAIPTQWRTASDILTSTLTAFLFSSHPKGKGIKSRLNYYTSAYNRGRQLSYRKTKLKQIQTSDWLIRVRLKCKTLRVETYGLGLRSSTLDGCQTPQTRRWNTRMCWAADPANTVVNIRSTAQTR